MSKNIKQFLMHKRKGIADPIVFPVLFWLIILFIINIILIAKGVIK